MFDLFNSLSDLGEEFRKIQEELRSIHSAFELTKAKHKKLTGSSNVLNRHKNKKVMKDIKDFLRHLDKRIQKTQEHISKYHLKKANLIEDALDNGPLDKHNDKINHLAVIVEKLEDQKTELETFQKYWEKIRSPKELLNV